MSLTIKNRFTASAIHFTLSLLIFSLFVFILLYHWYPEPYFSASGGWQGLLIVAAVDLVLGPLLTLIIFNISKPKKELIIDFSLIAILQISALYWGVSTVYSQRPLAVTFFDGKFYSVSAEHFPANNITLDELKKYGDTFPVYIYIEDPLTEESEQIYLQKLLLQSVPPNLQPDLFRPISAHYQEIVAHSIDIKHEMEQNPELKQETMLLLEKTNTALEQNYYIPLKSGFKEIIIVFDKNNKTIGYLNATRSKT